MGSRRSSVDGLWQHVGLAVALIALTGPAVGCHHNLMNSWLDPGAVGNFGREGTLDIRSSLSIQDSSVSVPGATEPTPDDLKPRSIPYRLVAGDVARVRIFELFAEGTESSFEATIDEAGSIQLPIIGAVNVAGMTARELEGELIDRLEQMEVLLDADVIVEPVVRRDATFAVFGAVSEPNLYPLGTPNLSLLEALAVAGGLVDVVTDIYVFREESPPPEELIGPLAPPAMEGVDSPNLSAGLSPASAVSGGRVVLAAAGQAPPEETGEPADDEQELIESIAPAQTRPPSSEPRSAPPAPDSRPARSRWIILNGKWIEVEPESAPASAPPVASRPRPAVELPEAPQAVVDWDAVGEEPQHRTIHVAARALRNGDPRQNIIVRPGDLIRLQAGEPGEYYLMGQVGRPGIYAFNGRKITFKSAIAAAGGLTSLAWPQRCTIYRRVGDREEMIQVNADRIFAGDDPDFFLKQDDLVVMGTHPATIFLAIVRNAFRLTYGFGFVYDRNFADADITEHQVKASRKASAEFDAANRFPGLF